MNPATGGPCQGIRNLVPELNMLGIENEIVCLDEPDSVYLKEDKFVIHAIGKSKGPWQYNGSLVVWLKKNISQYDAVVVHGLWLYHGYAVRKVLGEQKNPIPYFVMPHGMLDPYFQKNESRKLKAIRNNIYWKFIESKVVNNASGLLFTCEEEMNLARNTFTPYHPKQEINIGYGIPKPFQGVAEESTLVSHSKPYFLFLSRINPKKGIDILVEAYLKLLGNSSDHLVPELVIAGPGLEDDFGKQVFNRVQENNLLKDKVKFIGMLTGLDKWNAFSGCEAFILPSHQENFGIAVVEALACGKPVLIANKVNIWREIEKSNAGLVREDSVEGTLQLLQTWVGFSEFQKADMSKAALSCYNKYFTVESAAKRTYESMLNLIRVDNNMIIND